MCKGQGGSGVKVWAKAHRPMAMLTRVGDRAYLDAVDFGVAEVPGRARAGVSADALPGADGVAAARVGHARVWSLHALVVLAHEAGVAVGINLDSSCCC